MCHISDDVEKLLSLHRKNNLMKFSLKYILLPALLLCLTATVTAATIVPSSKYVTRKVNSGDFTAVCTNTAIDIIYTVGPRSIEVYAPDNLINYIKVSLSDSEIRVNYSESMTINGSHKSYVKISAPVVSRFTTNSAGKITIDSPLTLKDSSVELKANSAGNIKAKAIDARTMTLKTNSAGNIETANLKADEIKIIANSAGNIKTGNIIAANSAKIVTNSAGNITVPEVVAGRQVSVNVNSVGKVNVSAMSAPTVEFHTNSAGNINIDKIEATSVSAASNSVGNITVNGICRNAELTTRSSGKIDASGLKANAVEANVNGTGGISCWAIEEIKGARRGNGELKYKGKPLKIQIAEPRSGNFYSN